MKKFLKGLISFILVITLFYSTTNLITVLSLKQSINKNSIKEMITDIDLETETKENAEIKKVVDDFLNPIYEETRELGISDEVVLKIINSEEVKDFIGNISGNFVDYIVTGKNQKIINTTDIESLVTTAINDVSQYIEISDEDKTNIINVVKDEFTELESDIPDTSIIDDGMDNDTKQIISYVRFILGFKYLLILIIIFIVSILGLLLVRFKDAKWVKYVSITLLVVSIITSIVTAILLVLNNIIFKTEIPTIYSIISKPINFSLIISLSLFVLTIISLIVYGNLHKKTKKS